MKMAKILLLFILIISIPGQAVYGSADKEATVYPYSKLVTDTLYRGYRDWISPINSSSCPMHPTCSGYSHQSYQKHNPILATLKTTDRLLRCSNDLRHYNLVEFNGMMRYSDPVTQSRKVDVKLNKPDDIMVSNVELKIEPDDKEMGKEAKLLYQFARELELREEYDSAIIEYKRLLSYYPQSNYRINSLFAIFNILYTTEEYLDSIHWGEKLLREDINETMELTIRYYISINYLRLGNYRKTREFLKKIRSKNLDQNLEDKTYLVEGLTYAFEENWAMAENYFERIDSSSKYYQTGLRFVQLAKEGPKLDLKNPKKAGYLSIVPGLGYIYTGRKKTAVSSFLVNGLLFAGTYKAFENDNKALGTLLGSFSIGFYAGNIYGSYQTAKSSNQQVKEEHLMKFGFSFEF